MPFLNAARAWLEANVHPAAPYALLTLFMFAAVYAVRRWLPALWAKFESWGPENRPLANAFQSLPSIGMAALAGAFLSGGSYGDAFKGALAGAMAPFLHHLLKLLPGPYQGGVGKRDDAVAPTVMLVLLALLIPPLFAGCAGSRPIIRTVDEMAEATCALYFAEESGLSVEDAAKAFCATRKALDPFIQELTSAKAKAGLRARAASCESGRCLGPPHVDGGADAATADAGHD